MYTILFAILTAISFAVPTAQANESRVSLKENTIRYFQKGSLIDKTRMEVKARGEAAKGLFEFLQGKVDKMSDPYNGFKGRYGRDMKCEEWSDPDNRKAEPRYVCSFYVDSNGQIETTESLE